MTSADTDRRHRATVRRLPVRTAWDRVRAGLSLGVVLGLGATGTMAAWTDTATAESGLFGAAKIIQLTLNGETEEFDFGSVENVMPGGSAAGNLVLVNDGNVDLKYLMDMTVKGTTVAVTTTGQQHGDASALGDNLTLTVHEGGAEGPICSGALIVLQGQAMSVGSSRTVLTVPRPVNAGSTDTICVQAKLATTAPIQSRRAQVGVTFTINPEVA